MRVLVTGGAGFIGGHFVRHLLETETDCRVVNLDKLTYAGNPATVSELSRDPRHTFIQGDICDPAAVDEAFQDGVQVLVNFAAETHVDRSLQDPESFLKTDIIGVHVLLEAARRCGVQRFIQISTDEVYGSVAEGASDEEAPLKPRNPYAASKAGGDRLAYAYHATHGVPVIITRGSNNYGPFQYPEKLVPLFVTNALDDRPLPLYGDGRNVRDWVHVRDHCAAIHFLIQHGQPGEVYNIGGGNERENIWITETILRCLDKPRSLIKPVPDRLGHDRRYALDTRKLAALGWRPAIPFEQGLADTVAWYVQHREWWEPIKSGAFRAYYERTYATV